MLGNFMCEQKQDFIFLPLVEIFMYFFRQFEDRGNLEDNSGTSQGGEQTQN